MGDSEISKEEYQIILLRHAESEGNAGGYWQGQYDYPLTATGEAQATALAQRWKSEGRKFDKAISSPLLRARQTAEIISQELEISIDFEDNWMERDYGCFSGLKPAEAQVRYPQPDFVHPFLAIGESGESEWDIYLRAGHALQELLRYPPGSYLVVSHGGILNRVMFAILGIPVQANFQGPRFDFGNTGFATLSYLPSAHKWRLKGLNDQAHLVDLRKL